MFNSHNIELAQVEQLREALAVLRAAKKPLKFGRIAESFKHRVFRTTERWLRECPGVKRTVFKGKAYYSLEEMK
jgi:hypothetical protein